jgi:8-oxo-dGTP pyrophosphatase MutT (NUDIX family)
MNCPSPPAELTFEALATHLDNEHLVDLRHNNLLLQRGGTAVGQPPSTAGTLDRAFVVAAARETFEEAGLLLARRAGEGGLMDAEAAHRLVDTYRARLAVGSVTFLDVVRPHGAVCPLDYAAEPAQAV